MVTLSDILEVINPRKNQILLAAQMALPESQFQAFRKYFLDVFGRSGLEQDLVQLLTERGAKARYGQDDTSKKGGAP